MKTVCSLLVLVVMICLAGCGESKATVKGKIVENGQPKTFGANQAALQLTLIGPDGKPDDNKSFTAVVNEDGTFEVVASGGEIPIGKYQVAVQIMGATGQPYKKLAPPDSPIRRELKSGANELTIDLAKPE